MADILQRTNREPRVGASGDTVLSAYENCSGRWKLWPTVPGSCRWGLIPRSYSQTKKKETIKKKRKKRKGEEGKGGKNPWNKQQRGSCVQFPAACCFDHHVLSDAPIEWRVEHGHESKPVFLSALGLMRSACRNVGSTPSPRGLLEDGSDGTMPSFFFLFFFASGRQKSETCSQISLQILCNTCPSS